MSAMKSCKTYRHLGQLCLKQKKRTQQTNTTVSMHPGMLRDMLIPHGCNEMQVRTPFRIQSTVVRTHSTDELAKDDEVRSNQRRWCKDGRHDPVSSSSIRMANMIDKGCTH